MSNSATLEAILRRKNKWWKEKFYFSKKCPSLADTLELYQYLKLSLLDVNNWNGHTAGVSVHAELTDRYGRHVGRIAQPGDRIKIYLPRILAVLRLHDWFEVRRIEERLNGNAELFFIAIVPSTDPEADSPHVRDFPQQEWEISIFVIQDEYKVELQIHSRDSKVDLHGMNLKARIEYALDAFFIQRRYYKKQLAILLKALVREGSSNFTNLN
jgi:hypothetical protein